MIVRQHILQNDFTANFKRAEQENAGDSKDENERNKPVPRQKPAKMVKQSSLIFWLTRHVLVPRSPLFGFPLVDALP
jgi:hypothetical protein